MWLQNGLVYFRHGFVVVSELVCAFLDTDGCGFRVSLCGFREALFGFKVGFAMVAEWVCCG